MYVCIPRAQRTTVRPADLHLARGTEDHFISALHGPSLAPRIISCTGAIFNTNYPI